jgi:hypothetical protein
MYDTPAGSAAHTWVVKIYNPAQCAYYPCEHLIHTTNKISLCQCVHRAAYCFCRNLLCAVFICVSPEIKSLLYFHIVFGSFVFAASRRAPCHSAASFLIVSLCKFPLGRSHKFHFFRRAMNFRSV